MFKSIILFAQEEYEVLGLYLDLEFVQCFSDHPVKSCISEINNEVIEYFKLVSVCFNAILFVKSKT